MKDYYQTLGLKKGASDADIKQAYRKMAHKYHPDKANGDRATNEAKFKQINEAYQVLSDPDKRARYDQFGHAGVGGQGGAGNPFGGGSPFGRGQQAGGFQFDFGGFGFGGFDTVLEDLMGSAFSNIQAEVHISLTQAMLGDTIPLRFNSGESIELKIPPGTRDGQTFVFKGKGQQHKRGRGDLHIITRIQLPTRLSREQKQLFEKLRETGL
jgi:DnaJ-class molecular chaperone